MLIHSHAVRSVSCIYLAGITFKPASCGRPLGIVIKRSGAVLKGLVNTCTSFPQHTVGSFYTSLQSPEPRVLVGAHQCSQLVSTSQPFAFRYPFFLFFFLTKCSTVCGTQSPSVCVCCLTQNQLRLWKLTENFTSFCISFRILYLSSYFCTWRCSVFASICTTQSQVCLFLSLH